MSRRSAPNLLLRESYSLARHLPSSGRDSEEAGPVTDEVSADVVAARGPGLARDAHELHAPVDLGVGVRRILQPILAHANGPERFAIH